MSLTIPPKLPKVPFGVWTEQQWGASVSRFLSRRAKWEAVAVAMEAAMVAILIRPLPLVVHILSIPLEGIILNRTRMAGLLRMELLLVILVTIHQGVATMPVVELTLVLMVALMPALHLMDEEVVLMEEAVVVLDLLLTRIVL